MPVKMAQLVGAEVEAIGLVGRADLNGQRGVVFEYFSDKERCAVRFSSSTLPILVKPTNLNVPVRWPASKTMPTSLQKSHSFRQSYTSRSASRKLQQRRSMQRLQAKTLSAWQM